MRSVPPSRPTFEQRRAWSIAQLKRGFPGDADAIDALAELNPGKLPVLEPAILSSTDAQIAQLVSPDQKRWTVVWH